MILYQIAYASLMRYRDFKVDSAYFPSRDLLYRNATASLFNQGPMLFLEDGIVNLMLLTVERPNVSKWKQAMFLFLIMSCLVPRVLQSHTPPNGFQHHENKTIRATVSFYFVLIKAVAIKVSNCTNWQP